MPSTTWRTWRNSLTRGGPRFALRALYERTTPPLSRPSPLAFEGYRAHPPSRELRLRHHVAGEDGVLLAPRAGPSSLYYISRPVPLLPRRCSVRIAASASGTGSSQPAGAHQSNGFREWEARTATFTGAANVPFLLLQLPQITLNDRNLMAGNKGALFAVFWLVGDAEGVAGQSVPAFVLRQEKGDGGGSRAVAGGDLDICSDHDSRNGQWRSSCLCLITVTSIVVGTGLVLNVLNYFWWCLEALGGLHHGRGTRSATPGNVVDICSLRPNSVLPGLLSSIAAIAAVVMCMLVCNLQDGPERWL
ncbi:hypothetical protein Taro_003096 [Colocasia esculenta]|uniref:Uncharacterized protein n=1 Tax=Colocasia esculenta TaxID=4460 RepID=A0A843TQW8_COLES|nr:hypothetical protein [Colocasia esculenta]